jgi:hypothetical protein|nr:MAG TPA: hypothetical protein [Caudoviricetes sp.]
MKTTKNFKALENVINDCSNMGDTLFAIYGVKGASESKKGGQLIFTGDSKMIADGMVQIIRKSLAEDADKGSIAIANALLNAIVTVLTPKDAISLKFAELMKDTIDAVAKRRFGKKMAKKIKERADESIPAPPDDFDPKSKDCQECDDFADCLMRALINQAEKLCIDMITVQTNYKGRARKTKKANKNDEK